MDEVKKKNHVTRGDDVQENLNSPHAHSSKRYKHNCSVCAMPSNFNSKNAKLVNYSYKLANGNEWLTKMLHN